jgi:ribosomal protein S18 acetylase RimI-like enzyme
MHIRTATIADADSITEVHIASMMAAYGAIFPPEELARLDPRDRANRWREVFAEGRTTTLLAEVDGGAVGFVNFGSCRDDDLSPHCVGEVMAIYVRPASWRRGVGRRLMQEALDRLRAASFESVVLWTLEENLTAIDFYAQFGFVRDGSKCDRTMFGRQVSIVRLRRNAKQSAV